MGERIKRMREALGVTAETAARGDPERSMYDGYLVEKDGGKWQAEAGGLVVGSGLSYETALAVVAEHGAGRPVWRVDGEGTMLVTERA